MFGVRISKKGTVFGCLWFVWIFFIAALHRHAVTSMQLAQYAASSTIHPAFVYMLDKSS